MTKNERELMKALSLDVYGNANYYAKLMKKGEYRLEKATTNAGDPIDVKRWYPISAAEVIERMEKIKTDRAVAQALKAAEEAAKKNNEGGTDVSQENKEVVQAP